MSGVPIVKVFSTGEKPTAEDFSSALQILAGQFGGLAGRHFMWPLTLAGDIDMSGNRMLRVREMFGALNLEEYGSDQQAFDQAINELGGGGVIFVPRNNVIELSRAIKVRSNRRRVSIYGSGHSSQLKLADGSDDPVISLDGAARFTISNVFVNGNKLNNTVGNGFRIVECEDFVIENLWIGGTVSSPGDAGTAQASISIENCRNFTIRNLWISDSVGPAIRLNSCENFQISGCSIKDASNPEDRGDQGTGIRIINSSGGKVHSNDISGMARDGVTVFECDDIRVFGNRIRNCANSGFHCQGESSIARSSGVFVQGNHISGCEVGLSLGSWVYGQVSGNSVRGNVTPISKSEAGIWSLQNNQAMDVKNHGVVTMPANSIYVDLDVGVSGLPIESIQATWKYDGSVTFLQDSVLGAVYAVNGEKTVTFYSATGIAQDVDIFYSINV